MTCGECKDRKDCDIYEEGMEELLCIYEFLRRLKNQEEDNKDV